MGLHRVAEQLLQPDRTDELAALDLPVLVLLGEHDDVWPPALQAEMAAGSVLLPPYCPTPGTPRSRPARGDRRPAADLLGRHAGSDRRSTAPRVAPSTTANTAYPTGTTPRIANVTGVMCDGRLPWVLLSAPSSGCDHQVTAKVSTPTAVAPARAVTPSLVASHRLRVTDWAQASRWVPASSSRATSGAPQNTPMITGATATTTIAALKRLRSVRVRWSNTSR